MKSPDAKKILLQDSEFRAEYQAQNIARDTAASVIAARARAKLSQAQLAVLVGTKQPSIARIESGTVLPSLSFLLRIASALGIQLSTPELLQPAATIETRPEALNSAEFAPNASGPIFFQLDASQTHAEITETRKGVEYA